MNEVMHRFTDKFYNWISTYGPRIAIGIIIIFIGQWVIGTVIKWCKNFLSKRRLNETLKPFLVNLLKVSLQLLLFLIVMQVLGIKMTLFAAFIGALGVAAGLALSGTLQNFTSGVLIILLRPFRIGDNIKTQGEEGTVTGIRLFYTTIVTYTNTTLIVPNGKLSNEVIFNHTLNRHRRYDITLTFKREYDFNEVKQKLLSVISSSGEVLKDPAARIGVKEVQVDTYEVIINIWLNAHGYEDSKLFINERLLQELHNIASANSYDTKK